MRRNTYSTIIGYEDIVDAPNARVLHDHEVWDLRRRSGAEHVTSGHIIQTKDIYGARTVTLEVRFDSRAWTG